MSKSRKWGWIIILYSLIRRTAIDWQKKNAPFLFCYCLLAIRKWSSRRGMLLQFLFKIIVICNYTSKVSTKRNSIHFRQLFCDDLSYATVAAFLFFTVQRWFWETGCRCALRCLDIHNSWLVLSLVTLEQNKKDLILLFLSIQTSKKICDGTSGMKQKQISFWYPNAIIISKILGSQLTENMVHPHIRISDIFIQ